MPQTPRKAPADSGPGRGTPRARTAARPGERTQQPRIAALDRDDAQQALSDQPMPIPRAQRAVAATWRLVVLCVVIAGLCLVLATSLRVFFAQAAELSTVRAQIAAEKEKIAGLEDNLERWDDPDYVKSVARQRLGWVMPGEIGYRVIGADGKPLDGDTISTGEQEPLPGLWWEKMWGSVKVADQIPEESVPEPTVDPEIVVVPSPTPSR